MKIEIDQSGKVEDTSRATVIAFSNDVNRAIVLPSHEKKLLQRYFRSIGKPRLFMVLGFAGLVFLLVRNFMDKELELVIDREYPGYENFIKDQIIAFAKYQRKNLKRDQIRIAQIGKKSQAHRVAYNAVKKKIFNDKLKAKDVIKLLGVTKKSGNA